MKPTAPRRPICISLSIVCVSKFRFYIYIYIPNYILLTNIASIITVTVLVRFTDDCFTSLISFVFVFNHTICSNGTNHALPLLHASIVAILEFNNNSYNAFLSLISDILYTYTCSLLIYRYL